MSSGRGDIAMGRIRALLGSSRGQAWAYQPRPRLTEPDLSAWEAEHGVVLPEEYRQFLQEIGDGGQMPGSYCNFEITPLAGVRGGRGAATPFPVTAERLRQRLRQLEAEGWPDEGVLFPELEVPEAPMSVEGALRSRAEAAPVPAPGHRARVYAPVRAWAPGAVLAEGA